MSSHNGQTPDGDQEMNNMKEKQDKQSKAKKGGKVINVKISHKHWQALSKFMEDSRPTVGLTASVEYAIELLCGPKGYWKLPEKPS